MACTTFGTVEVWALIISFVALIAALLKDFILPYIFKPKLEFNHSSREKPFYREWNGQRFYRFSIKNIGKRPALNCRCQIESIIGSDNDNDLCGFPLKWATRNNEDNNPFATERLSIALDETEFVDLIVSKNGKSCFVPSRGDLGVEKSIETGKYEVTVLVSGDNFRARKLHFHITCDENNDIQIE